MMTTPAKSLLKLLLPRKWRRTIREHFVPLTVTHICGPKRIRLSGNEAIVTCVVKNGEFYIESFITHYSRMGFRHIFLLDNGSTDQTVPIAKQHTNVSVCRSNLPIDGNQPLLKKYLARQSTEGGWCLDADIDELFDYPFSNLIGLGEFLEYLNRRRYTAVITQLLDMFSDKPLSHLTKTQEENLREVYQYYDTSEVTQTQYHASDLVGEHAPGNELSSREAAVYFGGIRKTLYGRDWLTNCCLTKHSLFLPGSKVELFPHVHFVNNARLADISCVMLHYKLTSNALETALQNKKGFVGISKGYSDFIEFLIRKPDYQIKQNTSVRFQSVNELVDNGFLFVSEEYREYVRAAATGKGQADRQNGKATRLPI